LPGTLDALAEQAGIHVMQAGHPDSLKGGLTVAYRPAIYVAGDLDAVKNALCLIDGFFAKEVREEMAVQLHPHSGIDLTGVAEQLDYKFTELRECSATLPLSVFEAPTPKGGIVNMNVQVQSENVISLLFSGGGTYPFRQKCRAHWPASSCLERSVCERASVQVGHTHCHQGSQRRAFQATT